MDHFVSPSLFSQIQVPRNDMAEVFHWFLSLSQRVQGTEQNFTFPKRPPNVGICCQK